MIHQLDIEGRDKVEKAIMRLQAYEPKEGYFLCFSGGKDSCVIKALADMAGVKYDAHYAVTSVDPPELVRFIKDHHPDVAFDYPRDKDGNVVSMWNLIPKKSMPPTRIVRYCCQYLKEQNGHGKGRLKVTGVRWAESVKRKKSHGEVTIMDKKASKFIEEELSDLEVSETPQGGVKLPLDSFDKNTQVVEMCYRTHTTTINPIVDWDDAEVWEFIKEYKIPYCCLYDEGFKRLGCIGCPMGSKQQREHEFERWPKYKNLYMIAFQKMIENRGGYCGSITQPKNGGEYGSQKRVRMANRRGHYEGLLDGELSESRRNRDYAEMTPQEVIEWWID